MVLVDLEALHNMHPLAADFKNTMWQILLMAPRGKGMAIKTKALLLFLERRVYPEFRSSLVRQAAMPVLRLRLSDLLQARRENLGLESALVSRRGQEAL